MARHEDEGCLKPGSGRGRTSGTSTRLRTRALKRWMRIGTSHGARLGTARLKASRRNGFLLDLLSSEQEGQRQRMKFAWLLELRRMSRFFENLEAGASNAVAHFRAVLRRPGAIVTPLDDQRRHRYRAKPPERPRPLIRSPCRRRGLLRGRERDAAISLLLALRRWLTKKPFDHRRDGFLVPRRRLDHIRFGERAGGIGRVGAGRHQEQALDARGMPQDEMLGDDATHGAADQRDLRNALGIEHPPQSVRQPLHGVGSGFGGGGTEAGQVDRRAARALRRQAVQGRKPVERGLAISVDTDDRWLLSCPLDAVHDGRSPSRSAVLLELLRLLGGRLESL